MILVFVIIVVLKNINHMKKIIAIMLVCAIGLSASAQRSRSGHRNVHRGVRSHVSIGIGSSSHYSYNRFYSPFNTYPSRNYSYSRPSQLDLAIQDINNEYRDRISSARLDKSLTRQQRKQVIRNLRYEREKAIIDTRRNYYKRGY